MLKERKIHSILGTAKRLLDIPLSGTGTRRAARISKAWRHEGQTEKNGRIAENKG
jgi:hypothetical protein